MKRYEKILVGIDGSEQSKNALYRAIDLAQALDASLLLVTVVDNPAISMAVAGNYVIPPQLNDDLIKQAKATMTKYTTIAQQAGVQFEDRVLMGDHKTQMANDIPEKENADAIVIGATGLTRVERVFIGSTASYIMNNAKCDVIIVR